MTKLLRVSILIVCYFYLCPTYMYCQLNISHNHYRAGDKLIKQQVEFFDPGEAGYNRVWDFSKLKTIDDEYVLSYALPPLEEDSVYIFGNMKYNKKDISENQLIVGTEHNTMYYYRLSGDTLLLTGHENPTIKLEYENPLVYMSYPLNYGQTIVSHYNSKGLYSGIVDVQSEGTVITSADAYGKIIMTDKDTLDPVLRVKTVQTIINKSESNNGKIFETCRWYSKGYRYPIFETFRCINQSDSSKIFSTAFYYPPQDHLYLETDPENLELLDEIWNIEEENNLPEININTVTIDNIMACKIFPNPVESFMTIEYELKHEAQISFKLFRITGEPIKNAYKNRQSIGSYKEYIDCSNLPHGNYILNINANGQYVNFIIVKK